MNELIIKLIPSAFALIGGMIYCFLARRDRVRSVRLLKYIASVLVMVGAIWTAVNTYIDHEAEIQNRQQILSLQSEVIGLKKYSAVANLNMFGKTGIAGAGLKETTELSIALEGAYIGKEIGSNKRFFPRCDDQAIQQFKNVAEKFPDFPFSYWALAECLKQSNDQQWREFAGQGIEILEHTTQIAGHHAQHVEALKILNENLAE